MRLLVLAALGAAGCEDGEGDSGATPEDTAPAAEECASVALEGVQEVGPGPWTIDVSALGSVFAGGEVEVTLLRFGDLAAEEASEKLGTCGVNQVDIDAAAFCAPESAPISEPRTCGDGGGELAEEGSVWAAVAHRSVAGEAEAAALFTVSAASPEDTIVLSPP